MIAQQPPRKHRRRRTCWDRLRMAQQRLRRRGDPASAVAAQLLALVLFIVGRVPLPVPRPAPTCLTHPRPASVRRREDWSPDQEEREHGEGGHLLAPRRFSGAGRYRTAPSYRRLLRDLRRPYGPARVEALDVLRRRLDLPEAARGWLDEQAQAHDWSPLAACVGVGRTDADAEIAALQAAIAWLEARITDGDSPPPPPVGADPRPDDRPDGPGRP